VQCDCYFNKYDCSLFRNKARLSLSQIFVTMTKSIFCVYPVLGSPISVFRLGACELELSQRLGKVKCLMPRSIPVWNVEHGRWNSISIKLKLLKKIALHSDVLIESLGHIPSVYCSTWSVPRIGDMHLTTRH